MEIEKGHECLTVLKLVQFVNKSSCLYTPGKCEGSCRPLTTFDLYVFGLHIITAYTASDCMSLCLLQLTELVLQMVNKFVMFVELAHSSSYS